MKAAELTCHSIQSLHIKGPCVVLGVADMSKTDLSNRVMNKAGKER